MFILVLPPSLLMLTYSSSSSVVLMTLAARLINDSGDEKSTLNFIHDYLESRQMILKNIPVSESFSLLPSLPLLVALG